MMYVNRTDTDFEYVAGTKVFVYPRPEDAAKLYSFVNNNLGIVSDIMPSAEQYHCTVIYSKAACPGIEDMDIDVPMTGGVSGWQIFDTEFGKCLVALINSSDIYTLNKNITENYGATSEYPGFIPHITVAWNYEGELPTAIPTFGLIFDSYRVGGIDATWTPQNLL